MDNFIQVQTTTETRENAEMIAAVLLEKRLAACIQIAGPIESIYRWQGKVEKAEEWLCKMKTRADLFDRVTDAIGAIHPYEIPEIIAVPIAYGSRDYLNWLQEELISRGD